MNPTVRKTAGGNKPKGKLLPSIRDEVIEESGHSIELAELPSIIFKELQFSTDGGHLDLSRLSPVSAEPSQDNQLKDFLLSLHELTLGVSSLTNTRFLVA